MKIVLRLRLWWAKLRGARLASLSADVALRTRILTETRQQMVTMTNKLLEAQQQCEQAARLAMRLESSLEEEREKNRVHASVIDALVEANNVHLKRHEAEAAIQIRRQVAAMPGAGE